MPGNAGFQPIQTLLSPDLPFIIAVNGSSWLHRLDTLPDALFGLRNVNIDLTTNKATLGRVPNGLWHGEKGPRYTRVSGVLGIEHANPWSVAQRALELWHNPWAAKPIDSEWFQVTQMLPNDSGEMSKSEGETPLSFSAWILHGQNGTTKRGEPKV